MISIDQNRLEEIMEKHSITREAMNALLADIWHKTVTNEAYGSSFGHALMALRNGRSVQRSGWNGKGMWIKAQFPDEHSKMTHPYLYIEYPVGHPAYPNGSRVPWFPSQTDIMADDWSVLPVTA